MYLLTHAVVFAVGLTLITASRLTSVTGTTGEVILISIGASLIAAGLTGWVVYVYVNRSERLLATLNMVTQLGFVGAYMGRSVTIRDEYDRRMDKFSNRADILGFGLNSLRQDHLTTMPIWKARGRIRILLLDPEYPSIEAPYANQRDREEREAPGTICAQVKRFILETAPLHEVDRFEVRLYRCLPVLNIFRIDDEILWGPYFMHESSRNSPTFIVHAGGELFGRLTGHFDTIWNDDGLSRSIPAEWMNAPAIAQD